MNKLSNQHLSVSVPGKIILIGEHSVVYGYTALAMPLKDVRLTLNFLTAEQKSWEDAWQIQMQGNPIELTEHFKNLLTESFTLALNLFGHNISHFTPQTLFIDSQIPLGGGMGGSAAVSASLIKLCELIFSRSLTLEQEIDFANQIDSLFHSGRASGLDVSTILSEKLIHFKKGTPFTVVSNRCSFYVALVDSNERSETSVMIKKVAAAIESKSQGQGLERQGSVVQRTLKNLGRLAIECEEYLKLGNLKQFAQNLNESQKSLNDLGVSTQTLNSLCEDLIKQGALCAKLTGAGGGGLVLGIFDTNPEFLTEVYGQKRVFINCNQMSLEIR